MKLNDFLKSLLGEPVIKRMAECANTNEEMNNIFDNGSVFFNHFARFRKYSTFQILTRCFERGAALFTPYQFLGCDLIIPVFVPSTNEYTL